ncbi:MAG TPA: TfuA-like protein [Pararhizobium sp.]|uniref:TfuA-like protein n=1 Tax=Pararhizobium sp. TaxID=1977563 RepID=UPI002C08E808|nr:TfuA-like protein [Pararhizobium sp.]HTO34381.1 TfuA-like protein [Pararhizobium sp.]
MKIVFVGPSLPDAQRFADGMTIRPPALQGDIDRAIDDGATAIGLIDGGFEYQPPVWHKEILRGLSIGVRILGASSMGALRAAECADFGMIGIGAIFEDYSSGTLVDDAEVALLHGPAELGYPALTVPMVNVRATLEALHLSGGIPAEIRDRLELAARSLFFKDRTWSRVIDECGCETRVLPLLNTHFVDVKRRDALLLMDAMKNAPNSLAPDFHVWRLNQPFLEDGDIFA